MESEVIRELHTLCYIRILWSLLCSRFVTSAWFCNIICWPFEKFWITKFQKSFKCWYISLYNIKISYSLISPAISSEVFYVLGSCQTHISRYRFPKNLICAWRFRLYYWQWILSSIFLEVTVSFPSVLRKWSFRYSVWIAVAVPWEEWPFQLTAPCYKCCSLRQPSYPGT